jgi:transaldolase
MIKVPGSSQGYEVIEELTARGISTNNTLTFVLPQLVDCARSVERGLAKVKAKNVDLSQWRSVITHMESRYGDLGELRELAREKGVELTEGDVRLAELAIFKKAYKYLEDNNLPSKMLSCSLRFGPTVNGETRLWHLEEKTGASVVVTCPPTFIGQVINFEEADKIVFEKDRIHADIPADVMDKLMRVPYFEKSYAVDGYSRDEYDTLPALQKTAKQFSEATEEMVAFAGKCLAA